MQLVAYGAQDVYLTGNPKVTFFQAVYKRHTNFAMETIQQTINGSPGSGARLSVVVARNGDLLGDMFISLVPGGAGTSLKQTANATHYDTNWVAERAISSVELSIGGQRIDKHFQTWWRLYSELYRDETERIQYNKMTTCAIAPGTSPTNDTRVYLPLLFFFNRNPGLYLPLIALQYHEVRLDFELPSNFNSYFGSSSQVFEVWGNYVFLDTEERRRFAQKGHEYLIEQVQHTGGDTVSTTAAQTVRLSFNHPVKELVWCYQNATPTTYLNSLWNFCTNPSNVYITSNIAVLQASNNYVSPNQIGSPVLALGSNAYVASELGTNGALASSNVCLGWVEEGLPVAGVNESGPLSQWKLILNGQDRFKEQYGKYFNQYQPSQYHKGNPYPGIYCYSFALQPEEHQPTGTCNFSRIDNAQVQVSLKSGALTNIQKLFAVNYNVLRIQSGMGKRIQRHC